MFYVLLWICALADRVHSEELASPQDVHVVNSLLTWSPAHQHKHDNVTYTVQYRSLPSFIKHPSSDPSWKDVESCVETASTSCDADVTEKAKYGCAQLRVQAQTHNLTSTPVEACSRQGDSCSPSVGVDSQTGTLSVTLRKDHRLLWGHALLKYRVYYGLEGQPLEEYKIHTRDTISSVRIEGLEEGKSYCVYVQIVIDNTSHVVGPPSCPKCIVIRESDKKWQQVKIIASVCLVTIMAVLSVGIAYVLLHQREKIDKVKQWFKPEPTPRSLRDSPLRGHQGLLIHTPQEEHFDCILQFDRNSEEQSFISVQES